MRHHFCTITTLSHFYKVYTLFDSILAVDSSTHLHVLISDADDTALINKYSKSGMKIYLKKDIKGELTSKMIRKYIGSRDKLRWTLKPLFLKYLLSDLKIEKVIYVDNDIAFFGDFEFLFDYLDEYNILLTPHNYYRNPDAHQNWLEANFKVGLYNAGFLGVNINACNTLEWWAKCCLYRCEKSPMRGLFDDQKYLDLFPVIENRTLIVPHKGCNLADWNEEICKREMHGDRVLINGKYPVVFIHFNNTTVRTFLQYPDNLLNPYFELYLSYLRKYKPEIKIENESYKPTIIENIKLFIWNHLNRMNNM